MPSDTMPVIESAFHLGRGGISDGLPKTITFSRVEVVMRALLTSAFALALSACGIESTDTLRYRMTVEIDTPDGVKKSSSVIESIITKGPGTGQGSGITARARGEAVAVDLGQGGMVFALLSNGDSALDYHASLLHQALESGARSDPPFPKAYPAHEWWEEREAARSIRPTVILPTSLYPTIVRFRNITNPGSVEEIDPESTSKILGAGYNISKIYITITDDPVTYTVKRHLPWWDSYLSKRLDGSSNALQDLTKTSLSSKLTLGSFSTNYRK